MIKEVSRRSDYRVEGGGIMIQRVYRYEAICDGCGTSTSFNSTSDKPSLPIGWEEVPGVEPYVAHYCMGCKRTKEKERTAVRNDEVNPR